MPKGFSTAFECNFILITVEPELEFLLHVLHRAKLTALLLILLGPKFRFQVEKTFLLLATSLAPALEIVMDSEIIQNIVVLLVQKENEPLVKDSFK